MRFVIKVVALADFRVKLTFDDGVVKTVSLKEQLKGPIWKPVRKASYFRRVSVGPCGCIQWPNGADICPDLLYHGGAPPWALKRQKVVMRNGIVSCG
jgi:hypothetical protein